MSAIDDLIAQGKITARTDLSKSVVGIAVKAGAPKPDISTPETFRQALLAARSIGRSETGASGLYFGALIERLGLADALQPKIKVQDGIVAVQQRAATQFNVQSTPTFFINGELHRGAATMAEMEKQIARFL